MKYKYIIIIFVIGMIATIIGALFKLMHWPNASTLLTFGLLSEALSGILLIIKLITNKDNTHFLNK